jgi:hypothetical protein
MQATFVEVVSELAVLPPYYEAGGSKAATHFAFASPKESKQRKGDPTVCGLLGSEPKFAEPLARPEGALRRNAAKLVSDPNNLPCGARSSRGLVQTRLRLKQARALIRLTLRSSAHTEGGWGGEESDTNSQTQQVRANGANLFVLIPEFGFSPKPVLAGLRSAGGDG